MLTLTPGALTLAQLRLVDRDAPPLELDPAAAAAIDACADTVAPVSYTHLTLPTICSV